MLHRAAWLGATFAMAAVALFPAEPLACSVCVGWTDGRGLGIGFYLSALMLTALPFAVVAIIGVWVSRAARRARSRLEPDDLAREGGQPRDGGAPARRGD